MRFCEIAKFLNIPETVARSLGKQGILPGQPCAEGWETTLDEIERWYVRLSGKEWANLVADGQIDPLTAEIDLEGEATGEGLLTILRSWEQKGVAKIMCHDIGLGGNPEVVLTLYEAAEEGRKGIESLQHTTLIESVRSQIELACKCEKTLGENPVVLTLLNKRTLKLRIEDDMADLPQRDREIIRFYLASYALRLSAELR